MAFSTAFQDTLKPPSIAPTATISGFTGTLAGLGVAVTGPEGLPSQPSSVGVTVKT